MKLTLALLGFFLCINLTAQHSNVLISTSNSPTEPSIAVDPKNPLRVAAGSVLDNYYYSNDGGITWDVSRIESPEFGVWGDPTLLFDTAGHILYFHLANPPVGSWIDRIVCQKSTDNGLTWTDSYLYKDGNKAQDKQWAIIDRSNNYIHASWTQFDSYGSTTPGDSSIILYVRSTDGGVSWSPAKRISFVAGDCVDSDETVEGAVPAIGPNGEVYVAWTGPLGLAFNKSLDGGITWMEREQVITEVPGGWDFAIPGIFRANGMPETVCDLSNGPNHGSLYVSWSDQRNGEDDTDVWLVKSTDGGTTWSAIKRVNDDASGRHQFFHWMTIDQVTGYLWWVWYDRRNTTDNLTEVYGAVSKDGGETFTNFKISESAFNPRADVFFGDYTNISAHDNIVRPIWTRLDNFNLSVYTAIINPLMVGIEQQSDASVIEMDQNYPNPVTDKTCFSFKLHKKMPVSLYVEDMLGQRVACLMHDQITAELRNIITFSPSEYNLKPGVYYFNLVCNESSVRKKMIVAD